MPPAVAGAKAGAIDAALAPYLHPADKAGQKPLDYAVVIPPDFGASPLVRLWANGQPRPGFVAQLQTVLTGELRARYLRAQGVAPEVAIAANAAAPQVALTTPPEGSGRERLLIRSILPLAVAYILLMSLLLSGSWMLQGSVEERSNKLIESVLACVSPAAFMYGKLLGTVAIGLAMVATWVACGLFAGYATQGTIADIIRPALEPVSSAGSVATIVYFFVAGYVMVSMLFLVMGVMSNSMQEAQGYLTPVLMLIMIPFVIMAQAVLRGSGGIGVQVLTWIPLYTPFAVLARLGTGISTVEVVGSGALLAAFIAGELVLLGRLFRASLLNAGQRPNLGEMLRRIRVGAEG